MDKWKDADEIDTLAAAYAETGNFAEAVTHFEEDEANAISMRSLILAYEKNGQQGNAIRLAATRIRRQNPIRSRSRQRVRFW